MCEGFFHDVRASQDSRWRREGSTQNKSLRYFPHESSVQYRCHWLKLFEIYHPVFCSCFVNILAAFLFKFIWPLLYAFACSQWTLSIISFPSSIGNLARIFVVEQRPLWSSLKTQSCREGCIELYKLPSFLCKIYTLYTVCGWLTDCFSAHKCASASCRRSLPCTL